MREICLGICSAHGVTCEFEYTHEFAPIINWLENTAIAFARKPRFRQSPDGRSLEILVMKISLVNGSFGSISGMRDRQQPARSGQSGSHDQELGKISQG